MRDFHTIITHSILQTELPFPFRVLWSGLYIFHLCLFRVWIKRSLKDDMRFVSLKVVHQQTPSAPVIPIKNGDRGRMTDGWMDGIQEFIKSLKLDSNNVRIQLFFNSLLEFKRHFPPELIQVKALKPLGRDRATPHQRAKLKILARSLFLQAVQEHYDSSPRPGLEDMIESIMEPINNYYHSSSSLLWILLRVSFFLSSWMDEWSTKKQKSQQWNL